MTATIGRVGSDISLADFESWTQSGDRATITGKLTNGTQSDLNALRQQLLGYADNYDEEVIPVTWSTDARADGFYRVLSVSVDDDPTWRATKAMPYRVELERVAGFAAPIFESVLLGALRVNAAGIATGTSVAWHAVPNETYYYKTNGATVTTATRTGADGVLLFLTGGSNVLYDSISRWAVPPASYYKNAAKIEIGTTLRTVVGAQIDNLPANWRLSNGLVRVTATGAGGSFSVAHYDGTQWDTAKDFGVGYYAGFFTGLGVWQTVSVLRNSPEVCTLRLTSTVTLHTDVEYTVDISLRRGSRTVEGVIGGTAAGMIGVATPEAATALTGGIRATANDASGNRYVLAIAGTTTNDLVNGTVRQSAGAAPTSFMIGSTIGGGAATGMDTSQNQVYLYMAAQGEKLTVVSR